jgi:hypothetical protein
MNDRLEIATAAMRELLRRAKKPFTFQEIAHDALGYADALIAAAGEGWERTDIELKPAEPPIEPVETIKSDWSLRGYFATMRETSMRFIGDNTVALDKDQQDAICDLVEKFYGYPKPSVPRVEEIDNALRDTGWGIMSNHRVVLAEKLHAWLTERGAK